MNSATLDSLKAWFSEYTRSFFLPDPRDQKNISLKLDHTASVCRTIAELARSLSLSPGEVLLAEAVGLFHDLGRFPQFAQYRTFRDSASVNHGRLGAEVLIEQGVLRELPAAEQEIIANGVRFHNAFVMPERLAEESILFLRLIRDADKLDIWRIFLDYFEGSEEERASEAGLGLPDTPGYSAEVAASIFEKRSAAMAALRNINDFKLMQLSWVYDLNFSASVRLFLEMDCPGRIVALLPRTDEIREAAVLVNSYARQRLERGT